ncbi:MAG: YdjY domain-containing protein [Planctomycetes bacterium]|nr:YdjY domain-containing protein [Planctomycetota bacterium]
MMRRTNEPRRGESAALTTTTLLVLVGAVGFGFWSHATTAGRIDAMRADLAKVLEKQAAAMRPADPVAAGGDSAGTLDEKVDAVRGDLDLVANDIQRVERKLDDLTAQLENRGVVQSEPPQPPELDWTQPDLFEAARRGAESVGFTLTKDELRCPSRLVLHEGPLEYFAVLKGGKEHETLIAVVGNTLPEARRAKDMGVKLSNAIQALGFRRGKPIKMTANGTEPAKGETVWMFIEWTTGGKTEIVRAEDLVWHRTKSRPMVPGSWVYVGSLFVPGDEKGTLDYAADLTAELASTYSAPSTVIDNVDEGAQDDTVFLVATPRIPDDVVNCTLILRRADLKEGVKVFPAPGVSKDEAPKTDAPK